jgi:hypothetical protein
MMLQMFRLTFVVVLAVAFGAQANAQSNPPDQRYVVEYYYKAKWGYAAEFLTLFKKNHYPVLKKDIEHGRIVEVRAEAPRYHATEESRWDYRVTIVFRSAEAAMTPNPNLKANIAALYPDQATFEREEQRRFEILDAHWDVPIVGTPLD